ncbi:MAG TPA: TetR/AcrR family transcriptional regulator C-terminal domain-containing protein [Streptosporangiaceae bacterium]
MPRRRSLTSDRIAGAALAVMDREGTAGLSMRAVAAELGVGTMSLYRYVSDREELELLVVDKVLAAVDVRRPAGLSWQGWVAELAQRSRVAIAAHPAVVPLLLAHRHASQHSWRWTEAMLAALTEGGFSGQRRVIAQRCVVAYITGALQAQYYGPLSGQGTIALSALSPESYPLLAETARYARDVSADQEFRQGLDIVLQGMRSN